MAHNALSRRVASAETRIGTGKSGARYIPKSVHLAWCRGDEDPHRAQAIAQAVADVTAEARLYGERDYELTLLLDEDGTIMPAAPWHYRIATRCAALYRAREHSNRLLKDALYDGWLDAMATANNLTRGELNELLADETDEGRAEFRQRFTRDLKVALKEHGAR